MKKGIAPNRRRYRLTLEYNGTGFSGRYGDLVQNPLTGDIFVPTCCGWSTTGQSLHVLNAVSPAFTCSMPFARHVCDLIDHQTRFVDPE